MSGTPEHDDDALRAAVQRALRAPVDVDPQRREAAVRAAMEAADARMPAALPPRSAGRRNARPLLAAAAALVVVVAGVVVVLSGGSGTDQFAAGGDDAAGSAAEEASELHAEDLDEREVEPAPLEGAGGDAATGEPDEPPSTASPTVPVPVVDVGDHDGQRQLLAAVRRSLRFGDPEEREHSTATTAEPSTCELQLLAQGWTPVATGSIRDEPVLVAVNGEGSLLAVDAGSCRPYDAP